VASHGPYACECFMDHTHAVRSFAAERYVLGEMEENEAEAFEAHMFSCPDCAEYVRLGFEFRQQARRVVKQKEETSETPSGREHARFCRTFPERRKRPKRRADKPTSWE
jgi:anti-sigma factor RsiW